jgi:hypothetical protein
MACEHACAAKAFLNVRFYQDAAVVTEEECAFVLDPAGESGGRVWVTTDLPDQAHPDDGLLASQISDTYIGIASACLEKGLDRLYSQLSRGPANTHLYVTGHCTLPFWFYLARRIMARGAFGALKFIAVPFGGGPPEVYDIPTQYECDRGKDVCTVDGHTIQGSIKSHAYEDTDETPAELFIGFQGYDPRNLPVGVVVGRTLNITVADSKRLRITPQNFKDVCAALVELISMHRPSLRTPKLYLSFTGPAPVVLFVGFLFSNVMYGNVVFMGHNVRALDSYTYLLESPDTRRKLASVMTDCRPADITQSDPAHGPPTSKAAKRDESRRLELVVYLQQSLYDTNCVTKAVFDVIKAYESLRNAIETAEVSLVYGAYSAKTQQRYGKVCVDIQILPDVSEDVAKGAEREIGAIAEALTSLMSGPHHARDCPRCASTSTGP